MQNLRRHSFADTFANQEVDGSAISVTCAAPPFIWRLR
jgi:hypothetical protein